MPPEEAGYTYAVEPAAIDRLLANEEESIYGRSESDYQRRLSTHERHSFFNNTRTSGRPQQRP
jgi:predicted GIY-YIG superfamily endonuclease